MQGQIKHKPKMRRIMPYFYFGWCEKNGHDLMEDNTVDYGLRHKYRDYLVVP